MRYPPKRSKELKRLAKKLFTLLEKGLDSRTIKLKIILERIQSIIANTRFKKRFIKRALGPSLLILNLCFSQNVRAQAAFTAPVSNPFGLTNTTNANVVSHVASDMDNDGDLDILVLEEWGNFKYYENIGTPTVPSYTTPVTNPFGLQISFNNWPSLTIVDIDGDGDLDIFSSSEDLSYFVPEIKYYENIGSATVPNFTTAVLNPFGLNPATLADLQTADIDNDGDYDFFSVVGNGGNAPTIRYQENIGTAVSPNFGIGQNNPFGLTVPVPFWATGGFISIKDLDSDGDLDLLYGHALYSGNFGYQQNLGTATVPNFAASLQNPFGLIEVNANNPFNKTNNPELVDFDNDGDLDIITSVYQGDMVYFENVFSNTGPLSIFNISLYSPSCTTNNGTVLAVAGGGAPPITYKIGTDSNTTGVFTNYGAGTYNLRIRDSMNVIIDSIITISPPSQPIWDSLNSTINNVSCNGQNNGFLHLSALGGTLPYTFQLLPGFANPQIGSMYNGLGPNSYLIIITDANNCIDSANVTITEPPAINFSIDSSKSSCFGLTNGSIYTSTTGGNGGFIYSIIPAAGTTNTGSGDYLNLPANSYTITATDSNGCTSSVMQTITQNPQVNISISNTQGASSGMNDGSITSLASGGTPTYTYSIAPNMGVQTPQGTFTGLGVGNYTITATDANNCTTTTMSTVGFVTEVKDLEKHNIKVYPNPVVDLLKLESDIEITSLTVLDITGKIVKTIDKPSESISMINLPDGIYILKLTMKNEETVYTRITKQ